MTLVLSNAAAATAPDPARGAAGCPLLDPRTGRPVADEASVTVVGRPASRVRALADALRVMGRSAAATYARAHRDVGILWLEPQSDGVRAWVWNLDKVEPAAGLRVEWMSNP